MSLSSASEGIEVSRLVLWARVVAKPFNFNYNFFRISEDGIAGGSLSARRLAGVRRDSGGPGMVCLRGCGFAPMLKLTLSLEGVE